MAKLFFSFSLPILLLSICLNLQSQNNPRDLQINWKTNTNKRIIELNELTTLLQPDQIPPIYEPEYQDIENALRLLSPYEPLISLEIDGDAKGYPLSILMFHEIVNDRVGGQAVSVTYCPLCNAAIVFDRKITHNNEELILDFGVSGMLRKSDLVMWDHQTESWWQQLTGQAIVGELTSHQLKVVPSLVISVEQFSATYPNGKILKHPEIKNPRYGSNPYVNYDDLDNKNPFLFNEETDSRLAPMERVVDVSIDGQKKLYPYSVLRQKKVIHDKFMGEEFVVFFHEKTLSVLGDATIAKNHMVGAAGVFQPQLKGETLSFSYKDGKIYDDQTNSIWNIAGYCMEGHYAGSSLRVVPHANHFAFAVLAFYPESIIYPMD